MKNTNKKGFTIVELVIVIAVIAVLSAVLIPTFGGIIESANRAVDTQLVAQINTVLAIEDILGGGVNDAVEIQKVVKERGLKLQTKTKGQYIWYDIENKKVVLGGLDENGIVLDEKDKDANDAPSKGKFRATVNSPEAFVNGYLFISEVSNDGLAESVRGLRNAESVEGIQSTLADITEINGTLGYKLTSFMANAAVIKADGTIIPPSGGVASAKIAIVNSEMTTVKASTLTGAGSLADYTGIRIVDFHSGVVAFEDEAAVLAAMKATSQIKFCYNSDGVGKIDAADEAANNGTKNNLFSPDERANLRVQLNLVYIDQNGEFDAVDNVGEVEKPERVDEDFVINSEFPYLVYEGLADNGNVYDFVAYSFYSDGSNPIPFGTKEYKLDEYDKLLAESNILTVYAIFRQQAPDFQITIESGSGCDASQTESYYYGSGAMTYMLAHNALPTGATNIAVVSKTAKLDAALIGKDEATLTITSGVTLLIPYNDNGFSTKVNVKTSDDVNAVGVSPNYDAKFNKLASDIGDTKLTISDGVTLLNQGAIYVDAKLLVETGGNPEACFPDKDNCGVLELANGSKIETTGNLYVYGVIRGVDESGNAVNGRGAEGEGEIVVQGGNVTEVFTILDFHGGTDLSVCVSEKFVTPFHNWQVDNIRVKTTFLHGAKYNAFGCIYASSTKASVNVILADKNANSKPLFVMQDSTTIIQKTYGDGFELNVKAGNVNDATTNFDVSVGGGFIGGIIGGITGSFTDIDFTKVAMPFPNFDLVISKGATVTLSSNVYKLLPGSDITVDGTLNINTKLAIYESFERRTEDGTNTPRPYPSDWDPATLTVNGTLNLNNAENDKTALAGEIIPGSAEAVINVKGDVGQPNFSEGYADSNENWYPTSIAGQPSKTVLNGAELSLTKGETYTVKTESALGKIYYIWVK